MAVAEFRFADPARIDQANSHAPFEEIGEVAGTFFEQSIFALRTNRHDDSLLVPQLSRLEQDNGNAIARRTDEHDGFGAGGPDGLLPETLLRHQRVFGDDSQQQSPATSKFLMKFFDEKRMGLRLSVSRGKLVRQRGRHLGERFWFQLLFQFRRPASQAVGRQARTEFRFR